jgi:nucleoid-associated protein YgaU
MPDDNSPPPRAPAEPTETWLASQRPPPADRRSAGGRSALPWVIGAIVVLAVAVLAGYGTAYLVASLQHVPAPPAALLPTPRPSGPPAAGSPVAATATPNGSVAPTRPPLVTRPPRTPAETPRVHVVARGEFLSGIAEQYGVDPQAIIDLNEIENPNRIFPGQELLIPPPTGP